MSKKSYVEKLEEHIEDLQEKFTILWDLFIKVGKQYPGIIKSPHIFQSILSVDEVLEYVKNSDEWEVTKEKHISHSEYVCIYKEALEKGYNVRYDIPCDLVDETSKVIGDKQRIMTAKLLEFIVNKKIAHSDSKFESLLEFAYDIKTNKGVEK